MKNNPIDPEELAKELQKESSIFADKFAQAVKEGSHFAGERILSAVEQFIHPSSIFVEKLAAAAKEGAQIGDDQIKDAVNELIEPSSILAQHFIAAVKEGANLAGGQIILAGLEFFQAVRESKAAKE